MNRRQQELLPDLVHLFTDDAHDLVDRAVSEKEGRIDSRAKLPNIPGPQQEFVACHLGVGGRLAKGGDKKFRPTMHVYPYLLSCRNGLDGRPVPFLAQKI